MITMTCENCGQQLNIPERFAGQKGTCKHCGAPMTVPTLETEGEAPVRAEEFAGFNIMHDDHTQPNYVDVSNKPQTTIKKVDRAPSEIFGVFLAILGTILAIGGSVVIVKFVLANMDGKYDAKEIPPPGVSSPVAGKSIDEVITFLDAYRHISWYEADGNNVYIGWDYAGYPTSNTLALRVAENTANIASQATPDEVTVYLLDAGAAQQGWKPGGPGLKFQVGYLLGQITDKKVF